MDVLNVLFSESEYMEKRTHSHGRDPELEFVISQGSGMG